MGVLPCHLATLLSRGTALAQPLLLTRSFPGSMRQPVKRQQWQWERAKRRPTRWLQSNAQTWRPSSNQLVAMRMCSPSKAHMEQHYEDLSSKPFFASLIEYMTSGPLVAMLWRGKGVVRVGRTLLGETNPASSACGTIRGDGCIEVGRNPCHASDSAESGLKEAALWFPDESLDNPVEMLSEVFVYE